MTQIQSDEDVPMKGEGAAPADEAEAYYRRCQTALQKMRKIVRNACELPPQIADVLFFWCLQSRLASSPLQPRLILKGGDDSLEAARLLRFVSWFLQAPRLIGAANVGQIQTLLGQPMQFALLLVDSGGLLSRRQWRDFIVASAWNNCEILGMRPYQSGFCEAHSDERSLGQCAMAIATATAPSNMLAAISIVLEVEDKARDRPIEGWMDEATEEAQALSGEMDTIIEQFDLLEHVNPAMPVFMSKTQCLVWHDMFQIAGQMGGYCRRALLAAARSLIEPDDAKTSGNAIFSAGMEGHEALFAWLKRNVPDDGRKFWPTLELLHAIARDSDLPRALWYIPPRRFSILMRQIGVRACRRKGHDGRVVRGYDAKRLHRTLAMITAKVAAGESKQAARIVA